jgi:hypothetical protein
MSSIGELSLLDSEPPPDLGLGGIIYRVDRVYAMRSLLSAIHVSRTCVRPTSAPQRSETVHLCPFDSEYVTPCCGLTPFELPSTDQITADPDLVTCRTT